MVFLVAQVSREKDSFKEYINYTVEDSLPDWRNVPFDVLCTIVSLLHLKDREASIGCMRLVNHHWCAAVCQGMQTGVLRRAQDRAENMEPGETISWAVHSFPFLQHLDLKGIGKTARDSDMHTISALSQLTSLNVSMCQSITSEGIGALGDLPCLKYLVMKECTSVHDLAGIRNLQTLVSLDASHCDGLLDDGLANVTELGALSELVIYRYINVIQTCVEELTINLGTI